MVMNYKKRGEKMNAQNKPKIQPVKISARTKKEMAKFFLRTSVPRILEEERKKEEQKRVDNEEY